MRPDIRTVGGFRKATTLRYPLYEANGLLLLAAGSEITPRLRALIDRRGIHLEFQCVLEVMQGNPLGLKIPVKQNLLTIGRSPECEVRPDSEIVSSRHCRIHKRALGVFLIDLASTNGTFLNGERVDGEIELGDRDQIRLGNMIFSVELFAAVAADTDDDQAALDEWVLAEPFSSGPPSEPGRGPTVRLPDTSAFFLDPSIRRQ